MSSIVDKAKNAVKVATSSGSQFEQGYKVPIQQQPLPGKESDLDPPATREKVPKEDGGYKTYKAAGKLEGRKALITGGDSGIGAAVAILFAMEGADSLITYLPEEEEDAQRTKKRVEEHGHQCHTLAVDLKSAANCKKAVETAVDAMGSINILVNNHGTQMMKNDISEITEEQWLNTFDTNIHPFFFLSKYTLPYMKRGDTIINCASVNAYIGRPDLLDYTSAKGAIVAFTRGLSNQQISKGIRVNCVCPGPIWTPLIPSTMTKEAVDEFTAPLGRPGQPSEVATCFVFLASTDSSYMSGQSLHPNGGVVVNG